MAKSYEISEGAARKLAKLVRDHEGGGHERPGGPGRQRHVQYKPAFYRLATDEGDGEYAAYAQAWNAENGEFADVADTHHPEYNRAVAVLDIRGRDGAAVGAAGIGLIVHGWKVWVNGEWITLVDIATGGGAAETASFTAHYSMSQAYESFPEECTFWTLAGCLNSFLQICLDLRMCEEDLPGGDHPGNTET
ncbi:MAG TPA: hypothetical protein VMY35_08080, partial [Phycisphaerae bacterium]|nr:hypothetical protein [Phycisphaerae bacterium]